MIFLFRLGREGRQAELQKLRKEEKKLRGDGRLVEMAGLIGSKSQVCFFKHLIMSIVSSVFIFLKKKKISMVFRAFIFRFGESFKFKSFTCIFAFCISDNLKLIG